MPKLFGAKKTKKSSGRAKKPDRQVSPLMADEPPPSSSSSSRLKKDEQRTAQRKERDEKRKKREERLADSKTSQESSKKSKKKSKPKLSRAEQDEKDAKLGCWHKTQELLVKLVHVLDALIGFTFIVYGSLIYTQFETPAMEAVITSLTYGSVMLFTSIMGAIGFYTTLCKRIGLLISAYMAPLIAFFYVFVIIAMLGSPDTYFNYLTEHKDVLYLNDAEIATLKQIMPFFYIVMASLAFIEVCRFLLLGKVREKLIRFDSASQRIAASERSERSSKKSSRSGSSRSKKGSNRSNLTEPLIDEEKGGVDDEDEDY
eukprot:CAMPEP_0183711098 /NCGR_PEP_ID=MMETSP0737-20130205/6683_1 /TAXON_ID=385413 /ORGANISM="Thalassiosira miniscula, Strain CCMP1093" /LENGTH=314 /DNA_ID=CAMNT_0025939525 /DNA_START=74 /DNA_END=1018 /DNA_ORIENTATION=-